MYNEAELTRIEGDLKTVEYGDHGNPLETTNDTILAKLEKLEEKIDKIYWFMVSALASSLASLGIILFNFGMR